MPDTNATRIETTLRIPGVWEHPGELLERIPAGFRLTPEALVLPDGSEVEFRPIPPDGQFAEIFASSCRRPATAEETNAVNNYTVNIGLTGPGGSLETASRMMQAGAAIIQAGGAGVFNDNSGLSHGGRFWLELNDDGGPDALSFAFVNIIGSRDQLRTMGMHVLGRPEVMMRRAHEPHRLAEDEESIVEIIRYLCASKRTFEDGHIIAHENGISYQAMTDATDEFQPGSPMHNPWGRLKLVSVQEIAENN